MLRTAGTIVVFLAVLRFLGAARADGDASDGPLSFEEAQGAEPWTPPKPVLTVDPEYPPERFGEGLDVTVIVRVEINEEGDVTRATVFNSGGPGFDEAALKAARRWKFEPARSYGLPVKSFAMIYLVFNRTDYPLWEEMRPPANVLPEEEPDAP